MEKYYLLIHKLNNWVFESTIYSSIVTKQELLNILGKYGVNTIVEHYTSSDIGIHTTKL